MTIILLNILTWRTHDHNIIKYIDLAYTEPSSQILLNILTWRTHDHNIIKYINLAYT